MHSEYIEPRDGGYYVAGTRISLDSVVYAFNRGESPEQILEGYSLLGSLSRVYGAIAFYLANRDEIDQYMRRGEAEFDARRERLRAENPLLYQKLANYKRQRGEKSA